MSFENKSSVLDTFALVSVGCLAFSVSLGVALVSLSCLLIVLSCIFVFLKERYPRSNTHYSQADLWCFKSCNTVRAVTIALVWIVISTSWTIASSHQVVLELIRSARILVIPLVLYLIRTEKYALKVLEIWVYGQLFVIFSSFGLWLGIEQPWTTSSDAIIYFTPYSNTLDQPIMSSISFSVIWFFREHLSAIWSKKFGIKNELIMNLVIYILLSMIFFNVCFLMIGRSGMLSMIIVLTLVGWWSLSQRLRRYIVLLPFVIFGVLYIASPNFHDRIQQIPYEIAEYQHGKIETSQAIRLEFWHRSLQAIKARPILGYGVGSWPRAYLMALKSEQGVQADSPHQQFFLWWVEEGTIGFIFLLAFFFSILRDSYNLDTRAKYTLISVTFVLLFTCLMNCTLQGAGISEFFCVVIGILLLFQNKPIKQKSISFG